MSIRIMATVWEHSRASGTDLLVLLALADMADDGGECWPSMSTIGRKCRVDTRTARRRIRSLEELGEVVVIIGGGTSSRSKGGLKSNRYRVTVHIAADTGDLSESDTGDLSASDPDTDTCALPDTDTRALQIRTPVSAEPSLNRQVESSLVAAQPKRRRSQIPEDFQVTDRHRTWCIEQGIRADPDTEREKFVNHHRSKGTLFADHGAAFRTWMGNADGFSKGSAATAGHSQNADTIGRAMDRMGVSS